MLEIFPNPISQTATIRFHLPWPGYANLCLYDLCGTRIRQFLNGQVNGGWHTSTFDGSQSTNGRYLLSLSTPFGINSEPVVIVK